MALPVRIEYDTAQPSPAARPQWGLSVTTCAGVFTVILIHISCTGSQAVLNITTKGRWLDRRGVTSDIRFTRVYDKFAAQSLLTFQDFQWPTVNKNNLIDDFAPPRYLYDRGVARDAQDVDFRKSYADGNGIQDCWIAQSTLVTWPPKSLNCHIQSNFPLQTQPQVPHSTSYE